MDVVQVFREFWRLRLWLVLGLVVAAFAALSSIYGVSLFPPKLNNGTVEFGAASVDMLVDAPKSPIADLQESFDPLVVRSTVFAQLGASQPMVQAIAKEANLPPDAITAQGPPQIGETAATEPTGQQRGNQLISEGRILRVRFTTSQGQPVIHVFTQAATGQGAIQMANATVTAFQKYVAHLQTTQHVGARQRVVLRPLGPASGGLVNSGANTKTGIIIFFAAFIGWCLLMLGLSNLARGIRAARRDAALAHLYDDRETAPSEQQRVVDAA